MDTPNSLTIPDYTDHILAWRGWNITDDFYLQSYNEQYGIWGLVYTRAKCRNNNHPYEKAPVHICGGNTRGCGLYGVFNMTQVPQITDGQPQYPIGLAAYWGKAYMGDYGIRAEFAKPYCLIESDAENVHPQKKDYDFFCKEVSNVYSIPILHINDAIEEFKKHLPHKITERWERERQIKEAKEKGLTTGKLTDTLWRPNG